MNIMDFFKYAADQLRERGLQIKAFGKTQVLRIQPEECDQGIDLADAIALRMPMPSYDGVLHRYRRSSYPAKLGIKSKELFWRRMYEQDDRVDALYQEARQAVYYADTLYYNLSRPADRAFGIIFHYYVHEHKDKNGKQMPISKIAKLVGITLRQLYVVMWALSIPTREEAGPKKTKRLDLKASYYFSRGSQGGRIIKVPGKKTKKIKKVSSRRRQAGYMIHEGLGERCIGEEIMR